MGMRLTRLLAIAFIAFIVPASSMAQKMPNSPPKTPSEAYELATEPLREWGKSKNRTLETNIQAHQEQGRRAKEYVKLFKPEDWKGKQLFDLGQLYSMALLPEGTEKVFSAYLRDPAAPELTRARKDLLWALAEQQKWDEAIGVAELLLEDPKFDWQINMFVQYLIGRLRPVNLDRAIALSEKRFPKLFQLAQRYTDSSVVNNILENALELGAMYYESGNAAKSEEVVTSVIAKFKESSLTSNEKVRQSFEASVNQVRLIGKAAPPIIASQYIDMPPFDMKALKGKVVLLDFFAHWCAPCVVNLHELNSLKEKYESKGLEVVVVTTYYGYFGNREGIAETEELAALKALKVQYKSKAGLVVGPRSNYEAYGVEGLPSLVLIDRAGKVRTVKTNSAVGRDLENLIQTLLAEPEPVR